MTEMSRTMSAAELAQAHEMMQGCKSSDYRGCEYLSYPSSRGACEASVSSP
jgi:hypothetical protein